MRCFSTRPIIRKKMHYQYKSIDETKYLDVVYVPLPPDLMMVPAYDLIKRKRAEEALYKSDQYIRMLFDESTIGLALCRGIL